MLLIAHENGKCISPPLDRQEDESLAFTDLLLRQDLSR